MKKTAILIALVAIVLSSCKDKNAYTIKGTFNDTAYNGKMVYMQKIVDFSSEDVPVVLDSCTVKNGEFKMEGVAGEKPEMRFVSLGKMADMKQDAPKAFLAIPILERGDININVKNDTVKITGTKLNDEFGNIQLLLTQVQTIHTNASMGLMDPAEGEKELKILLDSVRGVTYRFTKENMSNPVGEFSFMTYFTSFDKHQKKELIGLGSEQFKNNENIKAVIASFDAYDRLEKGMIDGTLKVTDQSGKVIPLSDYIGKGKVVLLDFWASWCTPCIKEIPNLKRTYADYKSKGFEIVGISIDESAADWKKALKANNMPWVHVNDADGSVANAFGVQNIPFTVLLDKDGKMLAMGLRDLEIDLALEELFK